VTAFTIRPARPDEAPALSALCRRSKAHWGYDADFMAASEKALTIPPALIAEGRVLVAEDGAGNIAGVASTAPLDAAGNYDLVHLFVEPGAIGTGAGRMLFAAIVALIKAEGGKRLEIIADPFAEEFYLRQGAIRVGEAPSESIPGRMLPLLEYVIG
jgi:GNAT superfamily N-acetyltransferase